MVLFLTKHHHTYTHTIQFLNASISPFKTISSTAKIASEIRQTFELVNEAIYLAENKHGIGFMQTGCTGNGHEHGHGQRAAGNGLGHRLGVVYVMGRAKF